MTGMTDNSLTTRISADAQVAGISRNRLLELLRRSDFSGQRKNPELLPLNAADCACSRPLTKSEDEETITINRPGRSTYPEEKSVLTSGATPEYTRALINTGPRGLLSQLHAMPRSATRNQSTNEGLYLQLGRSTSS